MRNHFAQEVTELAASIPELVFLSGDIGNRLFNDFKGKFPERFFNCGVAEANMMSMAAGLAMSGLKPIAYTITPFVTTRCLEQIRDDVCYHNVPVVIVGVGAGLSYCNLGGTHHSCEDISFLRSLPNMTVICPGDALEVRGALREALKMDGPVYIRIGKKGEPVIHEEAPDFSIGKAISINTGSDVCLLSTGNLLPEAQSAVERLQKEGVSAALYSFHTVKPLDEACLQDVFERFSLVVTVEEHSRIGGLGGAVAEWKNDRHLPQSRLLRIGTPDDFFHLAGEQEFAREELGLDGAGVTRKILQAITLQKEDQSFAGII